MNIFTKPINRIPAKKMWAFFLLLFIAWLICYCIYIFHQVHGMEHTMAVLHQMVMHHS